MPEPKEIPIPKVGKEGELISFPEGEVRKGGQLPHAIVVTGQGRASGSALAATMLAEVSRLNQLGTPRPPRLVAVSDKDDKNIIYFIPSLTAVGEESVEVRYFRNTFRLSLFRLFSGLSLLPPVGQRDTYKITVSKDQIITPVITGYGLVLKVSEHFSEPIHTSEVAKLRRMNRLLERKLRADEKRRIEQAKIDEANAKLAQQ